ncbi:DUF4091 domain-containing protein [Mesorhizobium sp. BAC0120]|uniref:glycoside hydrolase domain-containing protein n=1 Tax=Mesorhizobium sp. BAC0120 TaxID=3090670 RepID=UPI00298CFBCF|nr:glycoside hydrolase domain-containing protein [Mesorhizobium sp. BAC0120]MDW6023083.1 DUF4091 domain-containing protein [Mesorhizobium sp. BAC0120]
MNALFRVLLPASFTGVRISCWLTIGVFLLALQPSFAASDAITSVWANDGGDKVTRDELRAHGNAASVRNSVWDGESIRLFAAANEVVSFNLVIEAADQTAHAVGVSLTDLSNGSGVRLRHAKRPKERLFDWTSTEIELFFVRYLQIRGLSQLSYGTYDERHVPQRLRLPSDLVGSGEWKDRPGADKFFPDIAVPLELVGDFDIPARSNQSVWADIYVPRDASPGSYAGKLTVTEEGNVRFVVPVELTVLDFALPDQTTSGTMVATSYEEIARRYTGNAYPNPGTPQDRLARLVADRQFMLARRHRISLVDDNSGATAWPQDRPRPEWIARLTGKLFSRANGYAGPGEGLGSDLFVVGLYGSWQSLWGGSDQQTLRMHTSSWESWFHANFPAVERLLYLADESPNFSQTEQWANWIKQGLDARPPLATLATANLVESLDKMPSVSVLASWIGVGDTSIWDAAVEKLRQTGRRLFFYNGMRPASGSFAVEDDGVALRELPWGQFKKGVDRWFFWNATYYANYQGSRGDTDVFENAQTFGGEPKFDRVTGMTGWNTSNGDGVLFYPGTDAIFPGQSYGLAGPIASLRLKYWRRGIQDVEYLALADRVDRKATSAIVERMVPRVLWETGVGSSSDPTWVRAPISWSVNPDDWEAARKELARIIAGRNPAGAEEGSTR